MKFGNEDVEGMVLSELVVRHLRRRRFSATFTSSVDGNLDVCGMKADGSDVRQLTHDPGRYDFPVWRPDAGGCWPCPSETATAISTCRMLIGSGDRQRTSGYKVSVQSGGCRCAPV